MPLVDAKVTGFDDQMYCMLEGTRFEFTIIKLICIILLLDIR